MKGGVRRSLGEGGKISIKFTNYVYRKYVPPEKMPPIAIIKEILGLGRTGKMNWKRNGLVAYA